MHDVHVVERNLSGLEQDVDRLAFVKLVVIKFFVKR